MITVAIARALAEEFGDRIESVGAGRIQLLPLRGEEGEAPLDDVEIAVYGRYDGPLTFRELVPRMPELRWIHSTGAGIDTFVTPELAERGVVVTNSSGVYAPAMAEYAIAGMVAIARDFRRLIEQQDEARWNHEPVAGGSSTASGSASSVTAQRAATSRRSAKRSAWTSGRRSAARS